VVGLSVISAAVITPDIAFKKSIKKPDPLKTFISQPLRNAGFLGPGGCEMKVFNGPI
jgi:hypothetical protein